MLVDVLGTVLIWAIGGAAAIPAIEYTERRFGSGNGVDLVDVGLLFVFAALLSLADAVALLFFTWDVVGFLRVIGQMTVAVAVLGGYSVFFG